VAVEFDIARDGFAIRHAQGADAKRQQVANLRVGKAAREAVARSLDYGSIGARDAKRADEYRE
jgi:hypothetical protein